MFRPATRLLLRAPRCRPIARVAASPSKRLLSTASPAHKSRTWKGTAMRWGAAVAAVYLYNTRDVFGEEPAYAPAAPETDDSEDLLTIDQIAAQRRQRLIDAKDPSSKSVQAAPVADLAPGADGEEAVSIEDLEEEASQQAAFNPETGEINWDCPCLGGMAHGPCGEEFKAAFSCFVHSTEEPKGMDCIDKFKGMQDCFRQYPDIYGAELEGDDDDDMSVDESDAAPTPADHEPPSEGGQLTRNEVEKIEEQPQTSYLKTEAKSEDSQPAVEPAKAEQEPRSEKEELPPNA